MATLLHTNIRGEQIDNATISGVHIVNASIAPIKADVYNSPSDGDVLTYKDATGQFEWNSIGTMTVNDSPTGSINGANTTFVLSDTPVGNTLSVFLNGILQQPGLGNDYTVSGDTITFTAAPETGDIILCTYLVSAGLGGGVYTDHGNLDGLGDDDHPQYILVDGSRAFTGAVAGVAPTLAAHLSTKGYVDDELDNQTHAASDITTGTFADARIAQSNVTQHVAALNHNSLLNTHNLTTDINHNTLLNYSVDQHRVINDSSTAATDLWSASKISTELSSLSQDSISEGNSKVEVVDTGTGYVTVEVDGSETTRFNTSNVTVAADILPEMTGASGTVSTRDIGSSSAKFNNIYCHDLLADAGSIYVNGKKVIEDVSDVITISTDTGQRLKLETTGDAGDVYIEGQGGIQFHIPSDSSNKDITFSNESPSGQINIGGSGQTVKLTGNVDISAGTVDHGNLAGLTDDDHTQYIKADGTRAFTGAVAGVTPTLDAHLTTKGYVDGLTQGLDWQDSVKDKDLTAPPGSPTTGDRYIVANSATGSWAGHDGDTAEYNGSTWDFVTKSEGMAVWVEDEDVLYTYNGSSWVRFGSTVTHANLSGLQGGTTSQYYHLTSAQHTDLTDGGDSSSHKHDDRYYTETEIDTWRNSTTQTEMGYVHGVTSDIQTQLNSKASSSHTHDDRYYTETELDAGQLDNRYYTESEVDALTWTESDITDLDKYTQAEITTISGDIVSQIPSDFDSRYYTETEIDTWRNGTTQTEMGYVHGVTSDIQTQLNGKLSTTGKAADADKLDNHDSTYFLNTSSSFSGDVSGTYDAMVVADDSHNHVISNVDGLQTALDGKSATSHTHDTRYYTESEVDTISGALNTKIDAAGHTSEAEYITISSGDITNKYTVLSHTPYAATEVMMDIVGGCAQIYSVDFTVSSNHLSWDSLALDGVIEAGDVIRVSYTYDA